MYDLVDDKTFATPDGRIPLIMIIQCGVFPRPGAYKEHSMWDYTDLGLFENQVVAFLGRGYMTYNEKDEIQEFYLDFKTRQLILNKALQLWNY